MRTRLPITFLFLPLQRGDEHAQEGQTCLGCNATSTPEWRRGPLGEAIILDPDCDRCTDGRNKGHERSATPVASCMPNLYVTGGISPHCNSDAFHLLAEKAGTWGNEVPRGR